MEYNKISRLIIGAAIEVHKELGPGKKELAYEEALARELTLRGLHFQRQKPMPIVYKGTKLECGYRVDLLVADTVLIEIKSVEALIPVHAAQVLTYLKLGGWKLGLLLNFNVAVLKDGIQRYVLGLPEPDQTAETRKTQRGKLSSSTFPLESDLDCGDSIVEELAHEIVSSVVAVQRDLGPGLLASAYEACLCHELSLRRVPYESQKEAQLFYKGKPLGSDTIALLVRGKIIVHPLAVNELLPVHSASLLSQLRSNSCRLGLLVNFNTVPPGSGIKRVVFSNSYRSQRNV